MIKLKTTIDVENEKFSIKKYEIHNSCLLEHLGLIVFLMEQIQENDETITDKEIFKQIKEVRKEMEEIRRGKSITKTKQ